MSELGETDIMKRVSVAMPALAPLARALLGCEWGQGISSNMDPGPCVEQAVRVCVIHDTASAAELMFKFCQRHLDYVTQLTPPHDGANEGRVS